MQLGGLGGLVQPSTILSNRLRKTARDTQICVPRKDDAVQNKVAPLKWLFYYIFSRQKGGENRRLKKPIRKDNFSCFEPPSGSPADAARCRRQRGFLPPFFLCGPPSFLWALLSF